MGSQNRLQNHQNHKNLQNHPEKSIFQICSGNVPGTPMWCGDWGDCNSMNSTGFGWVSSVKSIKITHTFSERPDVLKSVEQ